MHDLDGLTTFAREHHRERCEDERRLQVPGDDIVDDRREVRVLLRHEERSGVGMFSHPTGDRASEVSRDGEVRDRESVTFLLEPLVVQRTVEERQSHQRYEEPEEDLGQLTHDGT